MTQKFKLLIKHILFNKLLYKSLISSNKERGENTLKERLVLAAPDINKQYTTREIVDQYSNEKIRCQHTFQINLLLKAINLVKKDSINISDIGDSSGTHALYLKSLLPNANTISVNLDPTAIEKIKKKGLNAILCRAEELHLKTDIKTDIFSSFQMVEHLLDPASFLHNMSAKSECSYFVITIPYVRKSRMGLHYIRNKFSGKFYAENTHIFELSPEDWNLLFQFSGWRIVTSDIYTQFPRKNFLYFTKYLWRKFDFEGFYGVILEKDPTYSNQYQDWP